VTKKSMQVEVSIDRGLNLAVIRITGNLLLGEVTRHAMAFVERPDVVPGMPAIFDLREADFSSFGATDSRSLAEVNRRLATRRGSARVAFLVQSDLGYGVLRMHEVLGQSPNLQVRVFRDLMEAQHWVLGPFAPDEDD